MLSLDFVYIIEWFTLLIASSCIINLVVDLLDSKAVIILRYLFKIRL